MASKPGGAGRERGAGKDRPFRVSVGLDAESRRRLERRAERKGWTVSRTAAAILKRGLARDDGDDQ